jgi:hypothetical protein
MKPLLLILSLLAPAAWAETPPLRISFQSKLIDPATNNPKNGTFSMQFKLYGAPTGGAALFTETQSVAVANGVFSVQIGTVSLLSPDLFSGASAYLGVTVGADSEMLPRQPLSMSPYAFSAMQLVSNRDIRINAGTAYSTFTAAGNLALPYGIVAGTGTYANVSSTGVGTYGITTSSGISMGGGTLKIAAASSGIDATGTGITADTGTFTSAVTAKQFFGIGVTTAAFKSADTSRASTIVLADDPELAIPIGANEIYSITGFFKSSSTSITPDIKIAFTVPAGAAMDIIYHSNGGTLTTFTSAALRDSGQPSPLISIGANIINLIMFQGTVVNGSTAGFLKFQWAQNTSNATATTVTAGSYLAGTRIR